MSLTVDKTQPGALGLTFANLKGMPKARPILLLLALVPLAGCMKLSLFSSVSAIEYRGMVTSAQSAAHSSLSNVKEIETALASLSSAPSAAASQLATLADKYPLDELEPALLKLLSHTSDPAARKKLEQIYQQLFGAPAGANPKAMLGGGSGALARLVELMSEADPAKAEDVRHSVVDVRLILDDLIHWIGDWIGRLPIPPAPPVPPAPPADPLQCIAPLSDPSTHCEEWRAYAECMENRNRELCERSCPSRYCIRREAHSTINVEACLAGDHSDLDVQIPVAGYVCSSEHFWPPLFGNPWCPAPDPNNPNTPCALWDAVKVCLAGQIFCPAPLEKGTWCTGRAVACKDADGNDDHRDVCRWRCYNSGRGGEHPPTHPGLGNI